MPASARRSVLRDGLSGAVRAILWNDAVSMAIRESCGRVASSSRHSSGIAICAFGEKEKYGERTPLSPPHAQMTVSCPECKAHIHLKSCCTDGNREYVLLVCSSCEWCTTVTLYGNTSCEGIDETATLHAYILQYIKAPECLDLYGIMDRQDTHAVHGQ